MKLWKHQEQLLAELKACWLDGDGAVMIQAPTGSGKTRLGLAALKEEMARHPNQLFGWLTHRDVLVEQIVETMADAGLIAVPVDTKHGPRKGVVNIISPAARTLFDYDGLVVVDEAHHSECDSWLAVRERCTGKQLGLTATPWFLSKTKAFSTWDRLLHGPQPSELIRNKCLAPIQILKPAKRVPRRYLRVRDGDYDTAAANNEVMRLLHQGVAITEWRILTSNLADKRTLWFLPTVVSATALEEKLAAAGYSCATISAKTSTKDRKTILNMFKSGLIEHLISVNVLSEGLDIPEIPVAVSLRPTKSLHVWLQQNGRIARYKPGKTGVMIDMADNSAELGDPQDDRRWTLDARGKAGQHMLPDSPECWNCDRLNHISKRQCEYCGEPLWFFCQGGQHEVFWRNFEKPYDYYCGECCEVSLPDDTRKLLEEIQEQTRQLLS